MRTIRTLPRLAPLAARTLEYRDCSRGPDALRQLADAARSDRWGRAVELTITTDAADAPADCTEAA
jgi:hypothetical protein